MLTRVLHLPGRSPYARKLNCDAFRVVNDSEYAPGRRITRDMSFELLHAEERWDFFDLLHIHSLELADRYVIDAVLDRCDREGKGVVVTVHDVFAMFELESDGYVQKLARLQERGIPLITLTQGAANQIGALIGTGDLPRVVPHGYVVPPDHACFASAHEPPGGDVTFLIYGGFRPNRSVYPACVNAGFGLPPHDRLRVLTRGVSPVELGAGEDARNTVDLAASMRGRVDLEIVPFPSDDEIVDFLVTGEVLVMPYMWGTHSGQMETAFDLGLVPVISDVGYVREQWDRHRDLVPEPIWFDWSDGSVYSYGSRFVEALLHGREQATGGHIGSSEAFRQHRADEHRLILKQHAEIYERAVQNS